MSSMLRQHHVRIQDLVSYLRGYDPAKPQSAEEWSKKESAGFEPGMLIFCLERVSAPSGLAFGKKETEGETYRVKDLCVVVGRDNNRSLVVNITASAFELRYLEVLMLEKARKAILDGKDFLYVAVKPAQALGDAKLREIEELGAMYAQGGSRRSLVVDASGPQEPAVALLAALGVKLSIGGIAKQVLDIGSICHMLFTPEGRQEDKNKSIVKSCFTPIPNNEPIGKSGQTSAVSPQQAPVAPPQQRIRPAAPPPQQPVQDWGAPPSSGWAQDIQSPPDTAATAPSFGYEQPAEPQAFDFSQPPQPAPAFGYEQGAEATPPPNAGFGYDQSTPGSEPTPWNQSAGSAAAGFGLSGLNPFAPPDESETVNRPETHADFASQFKDDLDKGFASDTAAKLDDGQAGSDKWAMEPPTDFAMEAQKFSPPPDLPFTSPTQKYQEDQFPPSTVFNEQQFGNDHFKTPDFGSPVNLGPVNADLNAPPQEAFSSFPPIPPANLASDDVFQPPYAGATTTGEFQLPTELTAKLDPQNQLFQAPEESADSTTSGASSTASQSAAKATAPDTAAAPAVPEVNFGFDAFNQQPPSEFVDSMFDATSGAFEKTSRAMSFDEEIEQQAAAKAATPPAPSKSSTNLPAQNWSLPTEEWAQATPSTDWGIDQASSKPADEQAWTREPESSGWAPEPGAPGWAPEPGPEAGAPEPSGAPAWSFEGAAQAPAWTPQNPEPEVKTSASWVPSAQPAETATPVTPSAAQVEEDDEDEDTADGAPSLFDRLNQQLQKGSISEIEPPPVVPVLPGSAAEQAAAAPEASTQEPAKSLVSGLSPETIAAASEAVPTSSEYASTPLPPSPTEQKEQKVEQNPPPLGVSKKNAPLILDWPSSAENFGAGDTADNLPSVPAAGIASPGPLAGGESATQPSEAAAVPATAEAAAGVGDTEASGGIKHLAEALSGLMDSEEPRPMSPFANMQLPAAEPPAPPVVQETADTTAAEWQPSPEAAPELQSASIAPFAEGEPLLSADTIAQPEPIAQAAPAQPVEAVTAAEPVTPEAAQAPAAVVEPVAPPEPAPEEEVEEEEEMSPSAVLAAKGFQEPRLVMNEMASLMSKLEQQVQKAAKRLNSRAEEIKQRLLAQVDSLVADCTQIEKESQRSTTNLSQRLIKQLDDVCEESRLKVSDVAANGRYTIKQLLTSNQTNVDETKNTLYESLREACKQFRIETEALARTAENDLNDLVNARTEELNNLVKEMNANLDQTNSNYIEKLNARFERFKERMSDEASSVIRSLERNVRSMVEEIDGSWDRASDKLKTSKSDFEQTIQHSVKTAELNLSQSTRLILTNALIPKLRERQQVLRLTAVDLSKRFSDESERQVSGQILGLEASLGAARQQLQTLVDDCMSSIDSVGRGQQAGLEDIFKETSAHAERATTEVTEFLSKIETQINENEQTCKRLAEQSSIDNDPALSAERNDAIQRVQQLRQQANSELSNAIDEGCAKLESLSNSIQNEVTAMRIEQTQAVRDAAENGLTRVRDAIQEAFSAIQAAREKYME
ncbi:MAG: hypothetical protein JST44_05785 [Cyanobacteria bacterium SZAS LIN-5]|nr:hypothetical protein [Cyanobacteria bacterium SZAS LIN-5]